MSHDRMRKDEEALAKKVAELLAEAEATDEAEDAEHGKGRRGDELPEDLRRSKDRLAKIRAAKAALEAEARAQAEAARVAATEAARAEAARVEQKNVEAAQAKGEDQRSNGDKRVAKPEPMPMHQIPTGKDGSPTDKAQRNFTDADSRIMKTGDGFIQGYNAQVVVDDAHQIIVAQDVSNQSPDCQHLVPMIDRTVENCGAAPARASADNGYLSESNVARMASRGVDAYIAPGRLKHGKAVVTATEENADSAKALMRVKLATDEGHAIYARRKVIVEPVFGQIKNRGFRQFLLRGLAKVRGEFSLIALSHNLLKLFRARAAFAA
jgi:hypothetical protein